MTATIVLLILVSSITFMTLFQLNIQDYIIRTPRLDGYAYCFSEAFSNGVYSYTIRVFVANSGGSDVRLERIYITTDMGTFEVPITANPTDYTLGSTRLRVYLDGFSNLELWRGQSGFIRVEVSSREKLYSVGRVYSVTGYYRVLGYEGAFAVSEGVFKPGEVMDCVPPLTPPPLPQPRIPEFTATPFTWQLREYDVWTGWDPLIRFDVVDGSLLIDSRTGGASSMGWGMVFRYLPKTLLQGNKIKMKVDVHFSYWESRDVGYVDVVNGVLLNRRDVSYILKPDKNTEPPWSGLLYSTRAITISVAGDKPGLVVESNPLDLTYFSDWVTLVVSLRDAWVFQTVSLRIHWIAVVSPTGAPIVNFTFKDTRVLMEVSNTRNDYGILEYNWTQVSLHRRNAIIYTTFFNGGDIWSNLLVTGTDYGSCGGGFEPIHLGAYGLAKLTGSSVGYIECHLRRDIPPGSVGRGNTIYVAFTALSLSERSIFGGGFTGPLPGVYSSLLAGGFWGEGDLAVVRGVRIPVYTPRFLSGTSYVVKANTWYSGVTALTFPDTISFYASPDIVVSRSIPDVLKPNNVDRVLLGFNITGGQDTVYFDSVVVTVNVKPWLVNVTGVQQNYIVVLRNATGHIVALSVAGSEGVATLNIWGKRDIWGGFMVLDATIEVYTNTGTLIARKPVAEIVGGDIYNLTLP